MRTESEIVVGGEETGFIQGRKPRTPAEILGFEPRPKTIPVCLMVVAGGVNAGIDCYEASEAFRRIDQPFRANRRPEIDP